MKRASSPDDWSLTTTSGELCAEAGPKDAGNKKSRLKAPFRIVKPLEQYYKQQLSLPALRKSKAVCVLHERHCPEPASAHLQRDQQVVIGTSVIPSALTSSRGPGASSEQHERSGVVLAPPTFCTALSLSQPGIHGAPLCGSLLFQPHKAIGRESKSVVIDLDPKTTRPAGYFPPSVMLSAQQQPYATHDLISCRHPVVHAVQQDVSSVRGIPPYYQHPPSSGAAGTSKQTPDALINNSSSHPFPPLPPISHSDNQELAQQQQVVCSKPLGNTKQAILTRQRPARPALRLLLSDWIAHEGVLQAYAWKGVSSLYPWQAAALECGEDGSNLVYCAPTSGGKSLVAEILLIRQLLKHLTGHRLRRAFGRLVNPPAVRTLLVLPYVSIIMEKVQHLSAVLAPLGVICKGYHADAQGAPLTSQGEMLAVCTIEKANAVINRMVLEQRLHELVFVVVDEAHMVADPQRGLPLELSLSKIMHAKRNSSYFTNSSSLMMTSAQSALSSAPSSSSLSSSLLPQPSGCHTQLVCMSATMGGLETMCAWLDARLFMTNYRPVLLTEHAVFQGKVYSKRRSTVSCTAATRAGDDKSATTLMIGKSAVQDAGNDDTPLEEQRSLSVSDPDVDKDGLVALVAEVVAEGHSCLVFCGTRSGTEVCAAQLASQLPRAQALEERRVALVEELMLATGGHANSKLVAAMRSGVAFHNASLSHQERHYIETGFRAGTLLALTATSTLAAGINLPARRVILRTLWQGVGVVSRSQYLQMIGRAGRAGHSSVGESFIMGKGAAHSTSGGEWSSICSLLTAPLPKLKSCLSQHSCPRHKKQETGIKTAAQRSINNKQKTDSDDSRSNMKCSAKDVSHDDSATSTVDEQTTGIKQKLLSMLEVASGVVSRQPASGIGISSGLKSPAVPAVPAAVAISSVIDGGSLGECCSSAAKVAPGSKASAYSTPVTNKMPPYAAGSRRMTSAAADVLSHSVHHSAAGSVVHHPSQQDLPYQQMMLEGVANGSATTDATILSLIRSTLMSHQVEPGVLQQTTRQALKSLQYDGLIRPAKAKDTTAPVVKASRCLQSSGQAVAVTASFKMEPLSSGCTAVVSGGDSGRSRITKYFEVTSMGAAVHGSGLPMALGVELYKRLDQGRHLFDLSSPLQAIFICLLDSGPLEIGNWENWGSLYKQTVTLSTRKVLSSLGCGQKKQSSTLTGNKRSSANNKCNSTSKVQVTRILDHHEALHYAGNSSKVGRQQQGLTCSSGSLVKVNRCYNGVEADGLWDYILRKQAHGSSDVRAEEQHARLAVSCMILLACTDMDVHEVAEVWGRPGKVLKKGINAGELQRLQRDLSSWAGMASVLCATANNYLSTSNQLSSSPSSLSSATAQSAAPFHPSDLLSTAGRRPAVEGGWWQLSEIMMSLSQQAAAGVKPELMTLMQVPGMTGARARALGAAGFLRPDQLAVASTDKVHEALKSTLPRLSKGAPQSSTSASFLYLSRAATTLIESARSHVREQAQQEALQECLHQTSAATVVIPKGTATRVEALAVSLTSEAVIKGGSVGGKDQAEAGVRYDTVSSAADRNAALVLSVDDDQELEQMATARAEEMLAATLMPPSSEALAGNECGDNGHHEPSPSSSFFHSSVIASSLRGRAKVLYFDSSVPVELLDRVTTMLLSQKEVAISVALNTFCRSDHGSGQSSTSPCLDYFSCGLVAEKGDSSLGIISIDGTTSCAEDGVQPVSDIVRDGGNLAELTSAGKGVPQSTHLVPTTSTSGTCGLLSVPDPLMYLQNITRANNQPKAKTGLLQTSVASREMIKSDGAGDAGIAPLSNPAAEMLGVAIAFSHTSVAYFNLYPELPQNKIAAAPGSNRDVPEDTTSAHASYLEKVWSFIHSLMGSPDITKCVFGLRQQIQALTEAHFKWHCLNQHRLVLTKQTGHAHSGNQQAHSGNQHRLLTKQTGHAHSGTTEVKHSTFLLPLDSPLLQVSGRIFDPQLLHWIVTGSTPQNLGLKSVLQAVLPEYALRVPNHRVQGVTPACRIALAAFSLSTPLYALACKEGAGKLVDAVEVPLSVILGKSAATCAFSSAGHVEPDPQSSCLRPGTSVIVPSSVILCSESNKASRNSFNLNASKHATSLPTGSLSSLSTGSLTSLPTGSLTSLPTGSLTSLPTGSLPAPFHLERDRSSFCDTNVQISGNNVQRRNMLVWMQERLQEISECVQQLIGTVVPTAGTTVVLDLSSDKQVQQLSCQAGVQKVPHSSCPECLPSAGMWPEASYQLVSPGGWMMKPQHHNSKAANNKAHILAALLSESDQLNKLRQQQLSLLSLVYGTSSTSNSSSHQDTFINKGQYPSPAAAAVQPACRDVNTSSHPAAAGQHPHQRLNLHSVVAGDSGVLTVRGMHAACTLSSAGVVTCLCNLRMAPTLYQRTLRAPEQAKAALTAQLRTPEQAKSALTAQQHVVAGNLNGGSSVQPTSSCANEASMLSIGGLIGRDVVAIVKLHKHAGVRDDDRQGLPIRPKAGQGMVVGEPPQSEFAVHGIIVSHTWKTPANRTSCCNSVVDSSAEVRKSASSASVSADIASSTALEPESCSTSPATACIRICTSRGEQLELSHLPFHSLWLLEDACEPGLLSHALNANAFQCLTKVTVRLSPLRWIQPESMLLSLSEYAASSGSSAGIEMPPCKQAHDVTPELYLPVLETFKRCTSEVPVVHTSNVGRATTKRCRHDGCLTPISTSVTKKLMKRTPGSSKSRKLKQTRHHNGSPVLAAMRLPCIPEGQEAIYIDEQENVAPAVKDPNGLVVLPALYTTVNIMAQPLRQPNKSLKQPPHFLHCFFMTVHVPLLRLLCLAFHTADLSLLAAVHSPEPWSAVSRYWAASSSPGIPKRLLGILQSPASLMKKEYLDRSCSDDTAVTCGLEFSLGDVARCVVESLTHGEGPKHLAARLSSSAQGIHAANESAVVFLGNNKLHNPPPKAEGTDFVCWVSREEAGSLLAGFQTAFPGISKHSVSLVRAVTQGRHITSLSGRNLAVAGVDARKLASSASAQALLARKLLSTQLTHSGAEVMRAVVVAGDCNSLLVDFLVRRGPSSVVSRGLLVGHAHHQGLDSSASAPAVKQDEQTCILGAAVSVEAGTIVPSNKQQQVKYDGGIEAAAAAAAVVGTSPFSASIDTAVEMPSSCTAWQLTSSDLVYCRGLTACFAVQLAGGASHDRSHRFDLHSAAYSHSCHGRSERFQDAETTALPAGPYCCALSHLAKQQDNFDAAFHHIAEGLRTMVFKLLNVPMQEERTCLFPLRLSLYWGRSMDVLSCQRLVCDN
ncbi:hypothetical protein CEUSTIGMA_g12546.t1 [Chlamydomonas eustigma]|uniref:DNA-directed DNA polymerase n=1 Tax=Chlamydomonas eustigma TaxID=1157962 RepID=A0A250XQ09_9CHLO|nr:hypothetical protein CEUSTIGMA_g12546.t1 [Chlamydomonas eustigma]|eukprot:GAX85126.1 hypothetical protein CEUSTIGMA_g12546.t1 [Chlamydomonas eustigma]